MKETLTNPTGTPEESSDEAVVVPVEDTPEAPDGHLVISVGDTISGSGSGSGPGPEATPSASKQEVDLLKLLLAGVVIVLFVGFISVLITASITLGALWQESIATRSATYQNLVNQVTEQNTKMDFLIEGLGDLEMRHSTSTH